jgi:pimeloyl-ACP methyl ester carboxylesterase
MKRWLGLGLVLLMASFGAAEDALPVPTGVPTHGREYTIAGLPQSDYTMDAVYEHGALRSLSCAGTAAYIIAPKGAVDSERRWVWISNLFLALNDKDCGPVMQRFYVEGALAKGFHVVGIDVGASCGSPRGAEVYEAFYQMLVKEYRLNPKARMIGQSNGGLISYGYAFRHPEHVDRVLGIFPATDLASWPGLDRLCGPFSPKGLEFGLARAEMEARLKEFNPIDNIASLVKAGVKLYHIHGTDDDVVPLEPNSGEFARRYEASGGDITVEIVEGGNHGAPLNSFFESKGALAFLLE